MLQGSRRIAATPWPTDVGPAERPAIPALAALRTAACTVDIRVAAAIRAVPARMAACLVAAIRLAAAAIPVAAAARTAVVAADRRTANTSKGTKHQWEPKRVPTLVLSPNHF